ncbi:MAG: zinc finger domain-containing protein [Steroidobacterales bacterium]
MPELPDITLYLDALGQRIIGRRLERVTLVNPFLLRTATPPLASAAGRRVERLRRIGNAYSDEILHRARLRETGDERFPEGVTAFRPGMAVHGRFGQPCPVCGTPVQRIRYADNETNYCPRCQTEGRLLADRALSRLLKDDWPKTADELERLHARPAQTESVGRK